MGLKFKSDSSIIKMLMSKTPGNLYKDLASEEVENVKNVAQSMYGEPDTVPGEQSITGVGFEIYQAGIQETDPWLAFMRMEQYIQICRQIIK